MTSSTPDALWTDPLVRRLRPAAVLCRGLRHDRLASLDLVVPVGWRLLVVSRPERAASDLLRIVAGLARPRAGSVRLAGLDPLAPQRAGGRVAYVGPQAGLYGWMSPREALQLSARLVAMPLADRIEEVLETYGLRHVADRPMRRTGSDVTQRTAFAAAMLAEPEVLLLDDPLAALDTLERARLLNVPGPRRTVLLASRFPAREAGICDHVALVRGGRLALLAPVAALELAGLPLSLRGIEALADRRAPDAARAPRPAARAG